MVPFAPGMTTKTVALPVRYPRRQSLPSVLAAGISDILGHRRLAWYIVRADLKKAGADTLLGNVWWILDPLLQLAVYVILVSVIFQQRMDAYPLFVFAAILPWKWFNTSVNDAITSIVSRERIIKQVRFPKIVLPFASTVSGIVNFAFGLVPLFAMLLLFYANHLSWMILFIPAIAAVQFVFTLAVAMVLGAINVFFRDVGNLAKHLLRMWFYLSPALYTADRIADLTKNHQYIGIAYNLNPWAALFEAYHAAIYYGTMPDWGALAGVLVASIVLLGVAIVFFKRVEPAFAKVL